ncbi:MAG: PTS glucose transporter subunit IIA, partial [Candidatus Regiella insecticola]|nr:PTS glucose transporter subunit IIA [Candidatus Regiella insecticola]
LDLNCVCQVKFELLHSKITRIVHTSHAFYLTSSTGVEILIHIGIQFDKKYSHGFKRLVEEDSIVIAGQPILLLDLEYLNANSVSLLS